MQVIKKRGDGNGCASRTIEHVSQHRPLTLFLFNAVYSIF